MRIIDATNAADYLRERGKIGPDEKVSVCELSGGVSNVVLLVEHGEPASSFVLKQVRPQLRVADPWFSSVERIWREIDVLQLCETAIPGHGADHERIPVHVPHILFSDRENYLYAMSAAPPHQVWKTLLLQGVADRSMAAACGAAMGRLHAHTWGSEDVAARIKDTVFFDQLRVDPYYRHVARRQPDLAPAIQQLIESLENHPRSLVHGDFSPKNLLVHDQGMTLIDFEVGHYGDPAFDLGFFLTHLVCKAIHAGRRWWEYLLLTYEFWKHYESVVRAPVGDEEYRSLVARGIMNLAGCCLARVDGKSKVDYLDDVEANIVRQFARGLFFKPRQTWPETLAALLPFQSGYDTQNACTL